MDARFRTCPLAFAVFASLGLPAVVSAFPAGGEFRVNTSTIGGQERPAVAVDADGDFVVAWEGDGDGDGGGIYAQRYGPSGLPKGGEFRINTFSTGAQLHPSVAMDADGDFVVAWQSRYYDVGIYYQIYAKRYNAAGAAQGAEFRVNTTTTQHQQFPSVAMDSDGDFVVAWEGDGDEVYAQRYNAAGSAQGSEFRVNTYTTSWQGLPAVSMDAAGDFVVVWYSLDEDGSDGGIFAQRYNVAGAPQGPEFQVNSYTTTWQSHPSVALDSDGDFVVAWASLSQDGDQSLGIVGGSYSVYAQRYNSAGAAQGSEFRVNTYTSDHQTFPAVSMDADGDFVVTWTSHDQYGNGYGVFGQRFNAAGIAQGDEFWIDSHVVGYQWYKSYPRVALDANGDFVVAWQNLYDDGWDIGVYAQRYVQNPAPPDFDGDRYADLMWRKTTTGASWFHFMKGATTPESEGAGPTVSTNWSPVGIGDFDADGRDDVLWRKSNGATWFHLMNGNTVVSEGPGNLVDPSWTVETIADFNGDGKDDIFWRKANGATWFYLMDGVSVASEGAGNSVSLAWILQGSGDFDGDGKADLLWRKANGATWFYLMDGMGIKSQGAGNWVDPAWSMVRAGDFDADGKTDLLWRNPTSGATWFYLMNGMSIASQGPGNTVSPSWDLAAVRDLSGDGKADIFWRKTGAKGTWIYLMDGMSVASQAAGQPVYAVWEVVDP